MARRGRGGGTTISNPIRGQRRPTGSRQPFSDRVYGDNPRVDCDSWWDFYGGASGYLQGSSGLLVSRSTGTPTGIAQVANTANGELSATLAVTNEAEFSGVDFADELNIPASREFVMEAYVKMPALALTSVQDIVIGLATAYNSTLSSTTKYVWFRMSGSNVVTLGGKDGTTTNAATASNPSTTLTAATYYLFTIDASSGPGAIEFWLDDTRLGTLNQSAFAATDLLQPTLGIAKASGTGVPALTIDFLRISWSRL